MAKLVRVSAAAPSILGVLAVLLLWPPQLAAVIWTSAPHQSDVVLAPDGGTLAVRVVSVAAGGAAPAPGVVKPPPPVDAAPNVVVRVRLPDGSGELEQLTDQQGQTTFTLATGEYIAYLPADVQTQPYLSDTVYFFHRALPDGADALDWTTVDVVAADTRNVTLTATLNAP